jgi:hypothetical protein
MSTSLISNQDHASLPVPNQAQESLPIQPAKSGLDGLIDMLELSDLQKHFMRSRWLDQLNWMEKKAGQAKKQYQSLRMTAIIGGVIVPILISLNTNDTKIDTVLRYASIGLGGAVAVTAAIEEFFNYGDRWQHYRRTSESLKIQGWQFSQLSGAYQDYETHSGAFGTFVNQVEEILQHDVEVYTTQVAQEKKEDKKDTSEQNGEKPKV